MKIFLLSTFEDFITGSGIWILVGCLAFALLVSILFLILNVEKEKKMRESSTTPLYIKREEKVEKERIQPVEVKTSEEKVAVEEKTEPVATEEKAETKTKAKTSEKSATKSQTKAPAKKAKPATKPVATTDKKSEEKPKTKPVEAKKAETKAPAKKATPAKKVVEEVVEESGNYDISYDAETSEWVVKRENNSRATKRTKTKQEAIDYAKPLAEKNEVKLIIHTKKDSN